MVKKGGISQKKIRTLPIKKKINKPTKSKLIVNGQQIKPVARDTLKKNVNEEYIKFFTFYRKRLTDEHPRWSNMQISKIIGLLWKKRTLTLQQIDKKDSNKRIKVAIN